MSAPAASLLSTVGLSKSFGGVQAVHDVDLDLTAGEIRALIGPNGAGKTTLVSLICGRVPADSGRVVFLGEDISHLPPEKRIARGMAYTFQITSVFSRLSLHENVALAVRRRLHGRENRINAEVLAALHDVGLQDRAQEQAGDLSYGHQRLLEIAMGLAQQPKLLILDEPTQGLADSEIEAFNALIKKIAADTTILLIEHNMDVVMALADRITVLDGGAVLAEGPPDAIRGNQAVQAAYLGAG